MKINLGCGTKKLDGYVNVDQCGEPDIRWDLSQFPWPFEDESIDEVFSEHFLEHIHDYEKTIKEIHRILIPGGKFRAVVPHFKSPYYPWHLHVQQFSAITCLRLGETYPYLFEGKRLFSDIRIKFGFFWPKLLAKMFAVLSSLSPTKWEMLGLPIDEVRFEAKKV